MILAPEAIQPQIVSLKKIAQKVVALSLIFSSLFYIYQSARDVLFVLPKISFVDNPQTMNQLYLDLLKKAITISASLLIDSFYGFALLVKPMANTKIIHIVFGIFLFILSNFILHLTAIDQMLQHLEFLPLT